MTIHKISDPEFWKISPSALEDQRLLAESAGWHGAIFGMGDDENSDDIPVVALLHIPPNEVLPRHTHDCHRVEVMLEGTLQTENGDVLRPGDVSTSKPGEFYGPHTAGPTGSISIEIFSRAGTAMRSRTEDGERVKLVKD